MDHEQQVADVVQRTRSRFLDHVPGPSGQDHDVYDLEQEFAATRKNRSILVYLAVAGFLLVLGVFALIMSGVTERSSKESTVNIGAFEDLNLKEIFDTARKNRKDLESVQSSMAELKRASDARVEALRLEGDARMEVAAVQDASGSSVAAIRSRVQRDVAAERASLQAALVPLQKKAADIQVLIDGYDDRISQMNKKNKEELDTRQRLFDLEKQRLVNQYEERIQALGTERDAAVLRLTRERDQLAEALKEKHAEELRRMILKYNPVVSDPGLVSQFQIYGNKVAAYPDLVLPETMVSKNIVPLAMQSSLGVRLERLRGIIGQLQAIPWVNSVPFLVNLLDHASAETLGGIVAYLKPLDAALAAQDTTIANLGTEISNLTLTLQERDALLAERDLQLETRAQELALAGQKLEEQGRQLAQAAADLELAREQVAQTKTVYNAAAGSLGVLESGIARFVAGLREDGLISGTLAGGELLVMIKPDRARVLELALAAVTAPGASADTLKKEKDRPVALVQIKDGQSGFDVGTALVAKTAEGWVLTRMTPRDPGKPFKSFDRLVFSNLPAKP